MIERLLGVELRGASSRGGCHAQAIGRPRCGGHRRVGGVIGDESGGIGGQGPGAARHVDEGGIRHDQRQHRNHRSACAGLGGGDSHRWRQEQGRGEPGRLLHLWGSGAVGRQLREEVVERVDRQARGDRLRGQRGRGVPPVVPPVEVSRDQLRRRGHLGESRLFGSRNQDRRVADALQARHRLQQHVRRGRCHCYGASAPAAEPGQEQPQPDLHGGAVDRWEQLQIRDHRGGVCPGLCGPAAAASLVQGRQGATSARGFRRGQEASGGDRHGNRQRLHGHACRPVQRGAVDAAGADLSVTCR